MAQFYSQHGGLQRIQATIESHFNVVVSARVTVNSQTLQTFGDFRIVGGHNSAVTSSAKILGREKSESTDLYQHTRADAV